MTLLPSFFVLKSGGKYLTVPENVDPGLPSGFLKFNEEQIWNPRVKFAVEQAKTDDGKLVHIRSCYNNKYWVAHSIEQLLWIGAAGDKPEEDQSKDKCTLFEPFTSSGNGAVQLRHVQTQKTLIPGLGPAVPGWLSQGVELVSLANSESVFDVTNWETLVNLPSRISFKSEQLNGYYLCSRDLDGGIIDPWHPYQRFESGLDAGDPRVAKILFPTPDGNYRIKDAHFGKFWRRSPNWIWADGEANNSDKDTIFSVVKISDNVIALRNLGNNNFCGPLTTEGKTNCLNARYPTILRETRLMVEEFGVLKREISDVRYRLSDSRIYQEKIREVDHAVATNESERDESKITLALKASDSRTTHWKNSMSIKSGLNITLNTDKIPYVRDLKVVWSSEDSYSSEWEVSKTTQRIIDASYVAVVPPLKTVKVALMCTEGKCDVPFSYTQKDLLTTGKTEEYHKDDGIYTGIQSYNFYFLSKEVTKDAQGRMTESTLGSTPASPIFNPWSN